MKRVVFEISGLCDLEPIVVRDNKIALYVWMSDVQIKRNIKTLEWYLGDDKTSVKKIRAVK